MSRGQTRLFEQFRTVLERIAAHPPDSDAVAIGSRNVTINGRRLNNDQIVDLERRYRTRIQDGAFWYDRMCGAWGVYGGPTLGFIDAGLHIAGPLPADASHGDTGVFINGRELHRLDVLQLQQLGPVWPGRYWVDQQGNFGFEGGMMIGNLWLLASQSAGGGARNGGPWAVYGGGGVAAGDGQGALFAQFGDQTWSNW